jgi:hypothetical protein
MRRPVAQIGGDVRVFLRRSEDVEMGVAGIPGRHIGGLKTIIGVRLQGGCHRIISLRRHVADVMVKVTPPR